MSVAFLCISDHPRTEVVRFTKQATCVTRAFHVLQIFVAYLSCWNIFFREDRPTLNRSSNFLSSFHRIVQAWPIILKSPITFCYVPCVLVGHNVFISLLHYHYHLFFGRPKVAPSPGQDSDEIFHRLSCFIIFILLFCLNQTISGEILHRWSVI